MNYCSKVEWRFRKSNVFNLHYMNFNMKVVAGNHLYVVKSVWEICKAFGKTDNVVYGCSPILTSQHFFFKDRMSERNQTHCTLYYAHLLNSIQAAKKGTWGQTMILK